MSVSVTAVSRELRLSPVKARVGLVTDLLSPSTGLSTSGVSPARIRSERLPL